MAARCVYIDNDDVSIFRSLKEKRPTTVSVYYHQLTKKTLTYEDIKTKEYEQALRHSRAYHVQSREAFLEAFDRLFLKFNKCSPLTDYLNHIKNTVIGNAMVQTEHSRYRKRL